MRHLPALLLLAAVGHLPAETYYVDNGAKDASDGNVGTEAAPWKTIARSAAAPELKAGDTVLIKSGVYREAVHIKVSGEEGKPVTFAAAPGARVVIKGSEIVKGKWTRLKDRPDVKEPFPNAYTEVWTIPLGDEYFTDADFTDGYQDKGRRWVSQVFMDDERALQRIGDDPIYKNDEYRKLATVGRGVDDLIDNSFYFDPTDQTLYLRIGGEPIWFNIEVGVRGWVLIAQQVHDVVIRGLEMRHNRQPGGQWPMVSIGECERVVLEGCRVYQADFCGLGVGRCKNCTVRDCDLSYNGNTGLGMGECEDVTIENCRLLFNNYRRFSPGWHCGGMKCIPNNRRCTIRNCEAAYSINSAGIWFDGGNADIRIIGNVSHHNDSDGIFFEINPEGGVIADNLVYANRGRGIYDSGSSKTWIVHNTVVDNNAGIVCMPREDPYKLDDVHVLNNLMVANYRTQDTITRGCDLTLFMGAGGTEWEPTERTVMTVHSDHNVYANNSWVPFMRHSWNPNNTIDQWRERFGEDAHSVLMPVDFALTGTGCTILTTEGLDVAGPLPEGLPWQPANPKRVGCARTEWP
jgi:Right handed beta helix region